MIETIREAVGTLAPAGLVQTLVWALKVAVHTFIGAIGTNAVGWTNLTTLKAAGVAALGAGVSVILNALLAWTGKGSVAAG